VMEGKALLFKHLGAVDAVPLCVDVHDEDALVAFVHAIAPSFGGVNLEDIAAPKCFRVLERLQASLPIPVWHDDQQGTAAAVLAGLWNALVVVGKRLEDVSIALVGIGAANHAVWRMLCAAGADPRRIIACDSVGILHIGRADIAADKLRLREKWQVCTQTNHAGRTGGVREALIGADVCIAFSASGPDVIAPDWIAAMAPGAIVFACANPTPEIWPDAARTAAAAVAGRAGPRPRVIRAALAISPPQPRAA
jgi:malate dehydrogenase (oxaloacetate-decarboxylating)